MNRLEHFGRWVQSFLIFFSLLEFSLNFSCNFDPFRKGRHYLNEIEIYYFIE